MRVRSLGWRTDLALRRLEGSQIEARKHHIVIRSPENPGFYWGNFLLFDAPPRRGEAARWLALCAAEFPGAGHVAIGIDGVRRRPGSLDSLCALGLSGYTGSVLSARRLLSPPRDTPAGEFRPVRGDREWRQATGVSMAGEDQPQSAAARAFARRRMRAIRRVCERGAGAWFGAFTDGEMRAGLGIFDAGEGLARFQDVATHPAYRRRGLARELVLAAGHYAFEQFGAHTLVIAADPGYHAIELYRSLGFRERERQLQASRTEQAA